MSFLSSQGFGLEFSELREYTHGFFSNVAEILDDGFVKVYPSLHNYSLYKYSCLAAHINE